MNLYDRIPNNVNLADDQRLQRALEKWLPNYLDWWREMGPEGFQERDVYLRTAISVEPDGWAHYDYVKMPDYRWGIFLTPPEPEAKVGFGDNYGKPAYQEVPGEFRNPLRRIVVTQGDTEPASVEQQRQLGRTCPSLYDLRNLFQVNVEEGRHLWAMVYLLHGYFGRDGREEAEELLQRRSGNPDKPRILQAFNQPCDDWLNFYAFTMFTDRDGKYQLCALAESGFEPLARTCKFMLTEEAYHMFVGETGVGRIVRRAAQLMKESKNGDAREAGGMSVGCNIELPFEQYPNPYLDRWVICHYFFVRKVLLLKYSYAFVVLPGGFGTLDELTEALTLIQTGKIAQFPVVLMGRGFWTPLLDTLQHMLEVGTISAPDLDLVLVTDSVEEAMAHIEAKAVVQFGLTRRQRPRPSVLLGERPAAVPPATPHSPSTPPRQ